MEWHVFSQNTSNLGNYFITFTPKKIKMTKSDHSGHYLEDSLYFIHQSILIHDLLPCRPFVPQFKPNVTSHVLPSAAQAWHMQTSKRWEGLSTSKKSCLICLYLSHVNHMNTDLHSIRSQKKQYHNMRPDISTHFFQGGPVVPKICQSTFSVPHWVQLPKYP